MTELPEILPMILASLSKGMLGGDPEISRHQLLTSAYVLNMQDKLPLSLDII
jgi:hypothetical protein